MTFHERFRYFHITPTCLAHHRKIYRRRGCLQDAFRFLILYSTQSGNAILLMHWT
jgi:hypothetical protein